MTVGERDSRNRGMERIDDRTSDGEEIFIFDMPFAMILYQLCWNWNEIMEESLCGRKLIYASLSMWNC